MIVLCYKELELGQLTFEPSTSEFVYNSIPSGETQAQLMYHIDDSYNLYNSTNRKSKALFPEFLEFTDCLSRNDMKLRAKIDQSDNLYTKLEKVCKISEFNPNGFHIK